ncbi:uncharacterized protein Msr-110 [Venturia canescens]|uniref:uncharacterized protein Msr-110 n=1 Tax=Venturia canescens TaxID=32260 RepID=UPI001C9CE0D7|nr:uncharacterized protein LOC122419438 [Venturia canescens]
MEKDQLDSLATVAVGSEKMPPPHSHYAASDVYSASESPPAYTRPPMKSVAVQITRIIATMMIAISVIIGSFILASAWLQARASCTPENIAAMQAQMSLQKLQTEALKHLQPEALVQDREIAKEQLQSLSESSNKDEVRADTKDIKTTTDENDKSKSDSDNGDQNESDEDYDDSEFPPVHIKLPLQLDLDDLAGNLLQQARSVVSCVVERHRSDEVMDGEDDAEAKTTERQRMQRLRGEHVAILCESGDPRQEQQEQEVLTPIIVPLGTVQIPLQSQDKAYNSYQVHNQFQVPESQRVPMPVDARGMNPFLNAILPPELRNMPQISVEMGPPPRVAPQSHITRPLPMEMHQNPGDFRQMSVASMHVMRPPVEQEQYSREEQQQNIPVMFAQPSRPLMTNPQNQEAHGVMGQRVPLAQPQPGQESQQQHVQPRINIQRVEAKQMDESSEVPDRLNFPFRGMPIELRRIIQQVPLEINNIIQHITGESKSVQMPVPEGARREQVQEFKPFPESIRPFPVDPFALPIEIRNLLEHGNIEGQAAQGAQDSEDQQQQNKQVQGETTERKFPIPANVMNIIHQIMERREFPESRFAVPLRPLEVPVGAQVQVSDNQESEEESGHEQEPQGHLPQEPQVHHEEMQDEANRPHFVQPRSVRSVPEPFAHPREKRVRRCACQCAC